MSKHLDDCFETHMPEVYKPPSNGGHHWHEKVFSSMNIKCCMNCGFILNERKQNKPCPGPVYVGFRDPND